MAPKPPRPGPSRQTQARVRLAPPPRRPSAARLWLRRNAGLWRWGAAGVLGLGLLAGTIGAVRALDPLARAQDAALGFMAFTRAQGLKLQEIRIEGREHAPREALLTALAIAPGDPILEFDPAEARARLMEVPWVEEAEVQRRLPDRIVVRITERRPFAIWQRDGRYAVIDRSGRVLPAPRLDAFGPLPFVVGDGAAEAAAPMVDLLRAAPEIADRVEALQRVADRRWNLHLRNRSVVLLPEGHEEAAITRLAQLQASQALLDRPVQSLDMRAPDRLVVRLIPQAAPAEPEPPRTQDRRQRG